MRSELERLEIIRKSFRLPAPAYDGMTATEKAAASISHQEVEPWIKYWQRIKDRAFPSLSTKDQLQFIRQAWSHPEAAALLPAMLDFCRTCSLRTPTNALIETYLQEFPERHEYFSALSELCGHLAADPASAWYKSGREFRLWDPAEGPNALAEVLARAEDAKSAFLAVNFRGELHRGGFARKAVEALSKSYRNIGTDRLEVVGRRLIALLRSEWYVELRGAIAFSLLIPWRQRRPSSELRTEITNALSRYGDPRENGPEWEALKTGAREYFSDEDVKEGLAILARWLGEASVRQFFSIIQRSTGNTQHWKSREQFWSSYLDADLIEGAWFALGPVAQQLVRSSPNIESGKYAKLLKGSASNEQSTLIMQIGTALIAEWSDNGACRFWLDSDRSAPKLYEKKYLSTKLRTTQGGEGFAYISHTGPWQAKFAQQIKKMTGVGKPR